MHLTIQRETLLEPLQSVIGVVERRQTLPILANVLLSIQDDHLWMTATDLEVELIAKAILSQPISTPTQVTVSGRKLLDICKTLPTGSHIDLKTTEANRLIIRSDNSRFILATLPAENFPVFEETETCLKFEILQKDLERLLQCAHLAMAQQDVRYYLNGMLLDVKPNSIRTVATDGHRFAMNTSDSPALTGPGLQAIVPRKAVLELMRLLKKGDASATLMMGQNFIRAKSSDFTFTSKLIDSRFPDYERILSQETAHHAIVDRDLLREALLRVSILSTEKFRAVKLQLSPGTLRIIANNPEQKEEAEEILPADYSGQPLDIAFNVVYLLDALNALESGNILLDFTDSNGRLFIKEANHPERGLFLIMPVQL